MRTQGETFRSVPTAWNSEAKLITNGTKSRAHARCSPSDNVGPRWKITKDTVTITMSLERAFAFAQTLNEWKAWTPWVDRNDCKNWKRSPIARENKRESQTFGNCLTTVTANLGRRELMKLMAEAAALKALETVPVASSSPTTRASVPDN